MKKPKITHRTQTFYVMHFDHDEYLREMSKGDLVMTTNYLKAKRYDDARKAIKDAYVLHADYKPEDIGFIVAIVQVTISPVNPLLTALRRVKVIPF